MAGRAVALVEGGYVDLAESSDGRLPSDPGELLERWGDLRSWWDDLGDTGPPGTRIPLPPTSAAYGAPSPNPRQVFAVALNYRPHASEAGFSAPDAPLVFTKFPTCIAGPNVTVDLPAGHVDWEVELVVVIGRRAFAVPTERAWEFVAGVTVGQDLSERVLQLAGAPPQFSLAKSYPGFGPTGPALVTPDELPSRDDLAITCTLNGKTMQAARTGDMIFPVADLLARLSSVCPLLPGDLIFTGTPAGVGNRMDPPRFLRSGDVLVSEVEGVGAMRTTFREAED